MSQLIHHLCTSAHAINLVDRSARIKITLLSHAQNTLYEIGVRLLAKSDRQLDENEAIFCYETKSSEFHAEMQQMDALYALSDVYVKVQSLVFSLLIPLQTLHAIGNKFKELSDDFFLQTTLPLGINLYSPQCHLNDHDRMLVNSHYTYLNNPMQCLEYSFSLLNIEQCEPLCQTDPQLQRYKTTQTHFESVLIPQNGDLVIYGETKGNDFDHLHYGVYLNHKVISKWGDHTPIFIHELSSVILEYGTSVKFLRKKFKFKCEELALRKLSEVKKSLGGMTSAGIKDFFITYFKKCSKENLTTLLSYSLYGQTSLNLYRRTVITRIRNCEPLLYSRACFIAELKDIVTRVSIELPNTYL